MATVSRSFVENQSSTQKATWTVTIAETGANASLNVSSDFTLAIPTVTAKYVYGGSPAKSTGMATVSSYLDIVDVWGVDLPIFRHNTTPEGSMISWSSGTTKTLPCEYHENTSMTLSEVFTEDNKDSLTLSVHAVIDAISLYSGPYFNGYSEFGTFDLGEVATITLNAPPTYTATVSTSGNYYAGASTYSVSISNLTAQYGGDITSVVLTVGSQTATRNSNGTLSVTVPSTAGTYTPTVVATDSRGQTTTKTLSGITVRANTAPTCTATTTSSAPYYSAVSTYSVNITNATTYEDKTISEIKLTVGSQTATRTTNGTLSVTVPTVSSATSYTPTVVIKDSAGATYSQSLTAISVKANTVPTCTATVTSSGYYYAGASTYSVKITNATAYESKSVSSIKLTVGSQTATLTSNGTLSINLNTAGTFTPTVVITDNIGASKTYTLSSVTVYANTAPTFNAATSTSGNYYAGVTNYTVTISNATAYNNKTISEIKLTIGSQTVTRTANGDLTIKVSTAGTFTPVVTVTDNIGASATWNAASLTVKPNTVPSATITVNSSTPYYEGVSSRAYSVTLSNVTAYESKTITQTKLTIGSQTATGTGNGTLTITPTVVGTFTPVVTITDNIGATKSYSQTAITVNQRVSQVSNVTVKRIDPTTSELTDEGTNAVLTATFTYSKFTGNYLTKPTVEIDGTTTNNHTWYTGWTSSGGFTDAVNWTNYQPNSPVTLYAKLTTTFNINTSYSVSITPVTTVLTGSTIGTTLAQAFYLLAGKAGGHALGIGKKPEADYLLDIDLATNIDNTLSVSKKLTDLYTNQIITGGTATAAVTTSPYKPLKWTFNKGITPVEGDIVVIQMPSGGHDYGIFLSLDNGTTYKPISNSGTGRLTTHYADGSPLALVYDADWTVTNMYPLDGGTSRVTTTGGAWRVLNGYTDGNTYTSAYCETAAATAAKTASCTYFTLKNPCYMLFNIRYANTSAGAITMNVNGTGAKPIYINGIASSSTNYTLPAGSYIAYYNGTNWYFQTNGGFFAGDGVYAKDSTGFVYPSIRDNGSNLWLGAESSSHKAHKGYMYLSTGYDGSKGYPSVRVAVPNTTNTSSSLYDVWNANHSPINYSTCTTAATEQVKVATVYPTTKTFLLTQGVVVGVKFTNTNTYSATASDPCQLNVNGTGAKNIYWSNTATPTGTNTTAFGRANYINYYMYDGTNWVWLSSSADNNTTYSTLTLDEVKTGTSTATRVVTPKVIKDAIGQYMVGEIKMYAGTTIPTGWLACDGSAVSRTTYSSLFAAIGTTWGAGNGSTTFNLPNLKGRVPVGYDSTQTEFDTVGGMGGSKYIQDHTHDFTQPTVNGGSGTISGGAHTHPVYYSTFEESGSGTVHQQLKSSGSSYNSGSTSHSHSLPAHTHTVTNGAVNGVNDVTTGTSNNIQPYAVVKYIICAA